MTDSPEGRSAIRLRAILVHPALKAALALVIVTIAVAVLHHLATEVRWQDVKGDIARLPWTVLLSSVGFTVMSFAALSLYDVMAVETVAPGQVSRRIAAAAGACGFAISNLLGFSWLTGGAVRLRIYSSLGLDLTRVAGLIATSWLSIWLGMVCLLGLLLSFHPEGMSAVFQFPKRFETGLGLALLISMAGVFGWLWRGARVASFGSFRITLPTLKLALAQTVVAIVDILGAALALYVLLPADLAQNFAFFFVIYVAAIGLGIISHSPGGLGVFEATLIAGLGAGGRPDVLAALALYRAIYYLLPFTIAAISLAGIWTYGRSHLASVAMKNAHAIAKPLVPVLAAGIALISGVILLVSGSLPAETSRLAVLRDILPLPFIEAWHLAASIAGLLLIVIARGLYRKQYRAWLVALLLMATGFVASLLKGLDWEEALYLFVAFATLSAFRSAFYRGAGQFPFRLTWRWALGSAALLASAL